jgi:meiotic recombination protein SPO11
MSGSKSMSYDSASLTTRDIKWLGVRPTDLDAYSIPKEVVNGLRQ